MKEAWEAARTREVAVIHVLGHLGGERDQIWGEEGLRLPALIKPLGAVKVSSVRRALKQRNQLFFSIVTWTEILIGKKKLKIVFM